MPVFIIVTAISLVKLLINNQTITQTLAWFGRLSGVMFVIHPALREILLSRANEEGHSFEVLLLYFFLTIVISYMVKPAFDKVKK